MMDKIKDVGNVNSDHTQLVLHFSLVLVMTVTATM